jgi:hypothetical protein
MPLSLTLCGLSCAPSGPKVVAVSGTVTRNGKPVPNLFLNFEPDHGRPSWALADEQGRFTLEYDDRQKGAITGTHTVWVLWRPRSPEEEMIDLGQRAGKVNKPADLPAITEKYGSREKSQLRVEITKPVTDLEIKLD